MSRRHSQDRTLAELDQDTEVAWEFFQASGIPWWYATEMPEPWEGYLWHQWSHAWAEVTLGVCDTVWRAQGARLYETHRDHDLRDDLKSWLVADAVEGSARFTPDPAHPNPHLQYAKWLHKRQSSRARFHFADAVGRPDSPAGQAARHARRNAGPSPEHQAEIEAETGARYDHHAIWSQPVEADDPISVLIRLEDLAAMVEQAERETAQEGPYRPRDTDTDTAQPSPCLINLCARPARNRGLCDTHLRQDRAHTAVDRGLGCNIPDCDNPHRGHGLCDTHLGQHREGRLALEHAHLYEPSRPPGPRPSAKEPKPPCQAEGCARTSHARGYCSTHYQQWRRQHTPPCEVEGCTRASTSRGMCPAHYTQWHRSRTPAEEGEAP